MQIWQEKESAERYSAIRGIKFRSAAESYLEQERV